MTDAMTGAMTEVTTSTGATPRGTLLLLPYAGAMTMPEAAFRAGVAPGVRVRQVHLPGHGRRLSETPCTEPADAIRDVLATAATCAGEAIVLCGYSLGGRLAFEVARRLHDAGTPPRGLIVCMARGPHHGLAHPPIAHLTGDEFVTAAIEHGLASPELAGLAGADQFVQALRADLHLVERFPPVTSVLPVPTAVIGGRQDWLVSERGLRGWDEVVSGPVTHHRVDGGHLAIHESRTDLVALVAELTGQFLAAADRSQR